MGMVDEGELVVMAGEGRRGDGFSVECLPWRVVQIIKVKGWRFAVEERRDI